jgi:uncharacterized protein (TIGR02646 family)
VRQFVDTFKKSSSSVWNKPYIRKALLEMSHGKCAYCEVKLNKEGYAAIEHFWHKGNYPNEVVTWGNLLLSCTRCNTNKGIFDTKLNPFIHPLFDIPKEHLEFRQFTFFSKSEKGKNTVKKLKINDLYWLEERYELHDFVTTPLKNLLEIFKAFQKNTNLEGFNICVNKLIEILETALPTQKFSAITAHFILNDGSYQLLKKYFQEQKTWNERLINLENQVKNIAL